MADRKPKHQHLWQTALMFSVATFLSAKLGILLSVPQSSYVSFWLPAGLYVGVLLLNESRTWPWLVVAAITANILYDLQSGTPVYTALGFCTADTLEALAGAWLVRRFVAQNPRLTTLNEFLGLLGAAAILSPALGAAIGAATLSASGMSHSFWASWIAWWINNALAVLLVAPFILVWFANPVSQKPLFKTRGQQLEALLLIAALVGCTWYMLVLDKGITAPYKSRLLPLLLWAGLRFGVRGATAANLLFALLMGFFTTQYLKGLTPSEITSGAYIGQMQSFLIVSVIIALIPTIVILERDEKMLAQQESEERFRTLSDNLPDSMVYQIMQHTDGTMQFHHLSAGIERLNGLSAEAVCGNFSLFFSQIMEADRPLVRQAQVASQKSLSVFNVNVRMRRADGSLRWMNLCSAPRRLADGRIVWDGIQTDITERKRTEAKLTELHRQQERILTAVGEGLHGIDRDGKIIFENPAAAAMLGWGVDDLVGQPAHQVMHHTKADGSPYPVDKCHIYATLRDGVGHRVEDEVFWRKDGTSFPVTYTATPMRDESGAIVGAVVAFRDITERKRAESTLAALAIRHQTLLQTAREGIHILDEQGRVVEANAAFGAMLGYTNEEVLQLSVMDWDSKWSQAELLEKIKLLMEHPAQFETRHRRKDGIFIDVEISSVSVILEGHRYLYNSSRDITDRKRAEAALRESEQQFSTIFRESPVALAVSELDTGNFVEVNPALLRMMRASAESQMAGRSSVEIGMISQGNRARLAHLIDAQGRVESFLTEMHRLDGESFIANLCINSYEHEGRRFLLTSLVDITAQTRVEESHARLATVVEQSAEIIIITDTKGTIVYVNPSFEQITGYTRAEAIGRNPRMLKSGRQDVEFYRRMWDTLKRGKVWRGHFHNRRKDGTIYEEEATISPVRDVAGNVINYVGVKRDVTREVRLESELRQAQKMEGIGQLAGGVAHDFNNILSALLMQTDLLAMVEHLPEEARTGLQEIRSDVNRAAELTRQLLLFSRRQVMQVRLLDLNQLVLNLGKMLQRIIGEDVQLQLSLNSVELMAYADAGMLEQVLMNLCVNARDAMPDGGRLLIKTTEVEVDEATARLNPEAATGRYVCLSVSDAGVGIPPEILPKIFEPFFTTKEAGKGTGLGLATVFGIVKQHQGWIKVDNHPGQGVTFHVFLPASSETMADSKSSPAKPKPRGGTETILLVEDEESVRKPTRKLLERYGYQVFEAANGIEALTRWEENHKSVSLLLTDLVMPKGVSGQELARQLVARQPELKVIFISGYSADIAGRDFQLKPGESFIQKPCPPDHLIETIRRSLDG